MNNKISYIHLLETYEEYVHEDDLPIRFKEEK